MKPAGPAPDELYLHPGRVLASRASLRITTILGSCVAVCIWDRALTGGGMNHFVLPENGDEAAASPRFARPAILRLLEELRGLGSRTGDLWAKVFGGASLMPASGKPQAPLGLLNVEKARRVLAAEGIPVVAEDVGETRGRKLVFHTGDGSAWVRRL